MPFPLHHTITGTSAPLMVLHGLFGSLTNWQGVAKALASTFRVYTVDLRNHGASPHSAVMDYAAMAEDVAALMAAQGLSRAHLLGHSMGGKVAMQLALTAPEQIDRLIVVDVAPRAYPPLHVELLQALQALDLATLTSRTEALEQLAGSIPDRTVRQFLLHNLVADPAGRFRWRLNLPAIAANYTLLCAALPARGQCDRPALFIRGERSNYLRPADHAVIRHHFPQAHFHTIPNAGHWVHADALLPFTQAVIHFLGDL